MKRAIIVVAILALLSLSLVSCRNYNADDGMYGYYNNRTTDREYNGKRNVTEDTRNRIKNSYNKAKDNVKNTIDTAKDNVKNTFDNATEYIGNAMGVR